MATLVEAGSFMTSTADPKYTDSGNGMPSLDRSPPILLHSAPPEPNMTVANIPTDTEESSTRATEGSTVARRSSNEQTSNSVTGNSGANALHYGAQTAKATTGPSTEGHGTGKVRMMPKIPQTAVPSHRDESPGEKKWPFTPPQPDPSPQFNQSPETEQLTRGTAQHDHEFPFGRNTSLLDATAVLSGQSGTAAYDSNPISSQNDDLQHSSKLPYPVISGPQHPAAGTAGINMAVNIYMQANTRETAGFRMSPQDPALSASCSTNATQTPSSTPPNHLQMMNGPAQTQPQLNANANTLLYSAIGSLEVNANGSFNSRMLMANMLNKNQLAKTNVPQQTSQMSLYDDRNMVASSKANAPMAPTQLHQALHAISNNTQPITQIIPPAGLSGRKNPGVDYAEPQILNRSSATVPGARDKLDSIEEPANKDRTNNNQNMVQPITHSSSTAVSKGGQQQSKVQKKSEKNRSSKRVTIDATASVFPEQQEMFRNFGDAYTPRMDKKKIEYKPPQQRTPVQKMSSTMGTISRPNFRDALRRVAMILQQHIVKIERRFERDNGTDDKGLFHPSMKDAFCEDRFATQRYKCSMPRVPMARPGLVCAQRKIRVKYSIPTSNEIYEFAHQLFKAVQLSSECSIVCLIYVERLMEMGKVPLLANTWRPIFMCGLLLASKVWQDLSSWNIEFAIVYPQFSVDAINRLEKLFLSKVKWELYISSSLYAKYYFALRSLLEKQNFRNRYNRMVGSVGNVNASEALEIQKRTQAIKEEVISQLSRSC